jgi:hypothetical protein
MIADKFGWTAITLWIALALFSLMFMWGCQSYDYICEKDGEVTKLSIDILGTDSARSGIVVVLPTATFKVDESRLDSESIKGIIEEIGSLEVIRILKLMGAL